MVLAQPSNLAENFDPRVKMLLADAIAAIDRIRIVRQLEKTLIKDIARRPNSRLGGSL